MGGGGGATVGSVAIVWVEGVLVDCWVVVPWVVVPVVPDLVCVALGLAGGLDPPRVVRIARAMPPISRRGRAIKTPMGTGKRLGGGARRMTWVTAVPAAGPPPASLARSSSPSAGRFTGFFASELSASAASTGGASGRTADSGGGCSCTCWRTTSTAFDDSKGRRPLNIR